VNNLEISLILKLLSGTFLIQNQIIIEKLEKFKAFNLHINVGVSNKFLILNFCYIE